MQQRDWLQVQQQTFSIFHALERALILGTEVQQMRLRGGVLASTGQKNGLSFHELLLLIHDRIHELPKKQRMRLHPSLME